MTPAKAFSVLLVDDQSDYLEYLESILRAHSRLRIVGAVTSAAEAFAVLDSAAPDAVLLDVNMPDIDGFELSRQIRAQRPHVKIILMTAVMERGYAELAKEVGASGCVDKMGLRPGALVKMVESR